MNALSERGHEVHLVYKSDDTPAENKINEEVIQHRLKYSGTKGYFLNAIQLRKLTKEINPDIVNAHYASGYGTLVRLAKLGPLVLSVWGSDVYEFPYQSKFKMKLLVDNLRYANVIASTSESMAEQVRKLLKNNDKSITITPFGIDLNLFKPSKSIIKDEIIIGNIKSLKEIYGLNYLIKAIRVLKDQLELNNNIELSNRVILNIYGDGPERENLINLIKALDLEKSVFLKGKIPNNQVPSALESFDIFCATSIQESFGVSLIEAMSMELPVVATDVPGFKEIVVENKTGLIVESKNPKSIAKALEILILDMDLRLSMGQAGRKRVKSYFDWNKNVEQMILLYNNLLEREFIR